MLLQHLVLYKKNPTSIFVFAYGRYMPEMGESKMREVNFYICNVRNYAK